MKAGWKYVKLGELVSIRTGKLDANAANENGYYPFFTCAVEPLKINTFAYDCECVLIAGNGDLNVKYYNGRFNAYQRTYIIESKDKSILLTRYLYRFYQLYIEVLRKQSVGSTIKYIKLGNLTDSIIPLPSLSEQGEIVAYLDKEFALIDALREKATLQLQAAKDLFQSVYDSALSPKQSWCFKKLKDVAIYRRGSFPQPYGNTEWYGGVGEMPFVQVAELQEDNLNLMFPTRKNISKLAQPMSVFVPAGSVLVSLQGSIGKVAISQYDSYVDRTVAIFFDYKEKMDKTFFAYSLKRKFAEERLKARGTTIKTITQEEFAEFSIPLPTLSEQEEIVRKLDALSEKCRQLEENYRQTITLCNDLKQALLRQVFE